MDKADLHIHSIYSDGSDSIFNLIEKIKSAGINIFSLTDHDTIVGHFQLENIIPKAVRYIPGVELTCKYENFDCHILGYNYNPKDNKLLKLLEKGKILRKIKLDTRIDYLKKVWNIGLTKKELDWLNSRNIVVKTHLANILVNRNLAQDNVSAMKKYLDGCKTENTKFDAKEAVNVLLHSGAIPVWAHPLGGEGEKHIDKELFLKRLEIMKTIGIKGFECYYSRYGSDEQNFLIHCAKENNLLISGGSDYHGTNKDIPIGKLNSQNVYINTQNLTVLKAI